MLELLQIHAKGIVELSHGAGKYDCPPALVLLDDGETVLAGKLPYGLHIGRIRPELPRILLVSQVALGVVPGGYFSDPLLQFVVLTMPQDQRDLEPFRRVRLSCRSRARQWRSLASDKWIFRHSFALPFGDQTALRADPPPRSRGTRGLQPVLLLLIKVLRSRAPDPLT